MKTYKDFSYNLIESEIRGWDSSLIEKMKEWKSLDEETQIKIINGLVEGDESLIAEWGTLDEKIGTIVKKAGGLVRKAPLLRTPLELGAAAYRAAKGDYTGAGLSLGSAIPGPVGWGFVAADVARDMKKDAQASKQITKNKPQIKKPNTLRQNTKPNTTSTNTKISDVPIGNFRFSS